MRLMPFRTASQESVLLGEPRLRVQDEVFGPQDPVNLWDYMSGIRVTTDIRVDEAAVLNETGLTELAQIAATMQVDCPRSGFRQVSTKGLRPGELVTVTIEVPPHTVAHELDVRSGLTLAQQLPANDRAIAYQKGSRLYWDHRRTRFELEGQGGGFPVEAFDFESAGLPAKAAWKLNFSADDLDRPYMAAVRLLVNSEHPRSADVLSGSQGLVHSVVFHGVLEQLLLTVADSDAQTNAGFEEGTVGAVLDELSTTFLNYGLHNAVQRIRNDRTGVLARLQDSTQFLHGKAP